MLQVIVQVVKGDIRETYVGPQLVLEKDYSGPKTCLVCIGM